MWKRIYYSVVLMCVIFQYNVKSFSHTYDMFYVCFYLLSLGMCVVYPGLLDMILPLATLDGI